MKVRLRSGKGVDSRTECYERVIMFGKRRGFPNGVL